MILFIQLLLLYFDVVDSKKSKTKRVEDVKINDRKRRLEALQQQSDCTGSRILDANGQCNCPGDFVDNGYGVCQCPDHKIPAPNHTHTCRCPVNQVEDGEGGCECVPSYKPLNGNLTRQSCSWIDNYTDSTLNRKWECNLGNVADMAFPQVHAFHYPVELQVYFKNLRLHEPDCCLEVWKNKESLLFSYCGDIDTNLGSQHDVRHFYFDQMLASDSTVSVSDCRTDMTLCAGEINGMVIEDFEFSTPYFQFNEADTLQIILNIPEGMDWTDNLEYLAGETNFFLKNIKARELSCPGHLRRLDLCDEKNSRNVQCYDSTLPEITERTNPVVKLIKRDDVNAPWHVKCTGWRIGPADPKRLHSAMIITNYHCQITEDKFWATRVIFNSETIGCQDTVELTPEHTTYIHKVVDYTGDEVSRDYALYEIYDMPDFPFDEHGNNAFGYFNIDLNNIEELKTIFIPYHPYGQPKRLSIFDDGCTGDGIDNILINETTGSRQCEIGATKFNQVYYRCDTESGGSGSPIISYPNNTVIALHSRGGCTSYNNNQGISMKFIWPKIKDHFPHWDINTEGGLSNEAFINSFKDSTIVDIPSSHIEAEAAYPNKQQATKTTQRSLEKVKDDNSVQEIDWICDLRKNQWCNGRCIDERLPCDVSSMRACTNFDDCDSGKTCANGVCTNTENVTYLLISAIFQGIILLCYTYYWCHRIYTKRLKRSERERRRRSLEDRKFKEACMKLY